MAGIRTQLEFRSHALVVTMVLACLPRDVTYVNEHKKAVQQVALTHILFIHTCYTAKDATRYIVNENWPNIT